MTISAGHSSRRSLWIYCLPSPTMDKSSACSCRPTVSHPSTRRYLLPQGISYVSPELLELRPCGSLPSIRFGRSGFALGHFDRYSRGVDIANDLLHSDRKSFRSYADGGLTCITLQINVSCFIIRLTRCLDSYLRGSGRVILRIGSRTKLISVSETRLGSI